MLHCLGIRVVGHVGTAQHGGCLGEPSTVGQELRLPLRVIHHAVMDSPEAAPYDNSRTAVLVLDPSRVVMKA